MNTNPIPAKAFLMEDVTLTTPLLISPEEYGAGAVGILSWEYTIDGMRQHGGHSSKVTFSRGIVGETCIISIEPICNPDSRHPHYPAGSLPVTFVTVAHGEDGAVYYLSGDGMNTAGAYVKNDGSAVSKKGAGYGATMASNIDTLAGIVAGIVRASVGANVGRRVADPKAWLTAMATWLHDDRFVNGGIVTGASKATYRQ